MAAAGLLSAWLAERLSGFDNRELRTAFGSFMTGVTIVTTSGADGAPRGFTANSFTSVSLEPPLVLWSLAKKASSHAAFAVAEYYGVSVLAAEQETLSHHFSTFKGDRFAGLDVRDGLGGVPLIPDALAHFECRVKSRYDEGDHLILIGEVLRCDFREGEALVYRSRKYHQI